MRSWLLLGMLGTAGSAWAQAPRPSEEDLFQSPPTAASDAGPPASDAGSPLSPFAGTENSSRDDAILKGHSGQFLSGEVAPEDPLRIGGLLYLRMFTSARDNQPPADWTLSAPFLLDTYLDARPNDRVRGFVLVRTLYNPAYNPASPSAYGFALVPSPNPEFLIDQMWINLDVASRVFVTAGKQHVKWGAAHFWFPTDFLNPVKLRPLSLFDERTGTTMIKAQVPIESAKMNLWAIAVVDNLVVADTIGKVGAAGRAEVVFGQTEVGVDFLAQNGTYPRYGADISFGLGDFDLYTEVAMLDGRGMPIWRKVSNPDPTAGVSGNYVVIYFPNFRPQAASGLTYTLKYSETDVITFGGEYFYNGFGYSDPSLYPWLLFNSAFQSFYVGQHYAAVYASAPSPGSWDTSTFTLTFLGNLSDSSFIARLDYWLTVLTHLRFEASAQVHFGNPYGEFRLAIDTPAQTINGMAIPAVSVGASSFDLGIALRLSI
jgi:hypothetical protein